MSVKNKITETRKKEKTILLIVMQMASQKEMVVFRKTRNV